MKPGLYNIKRVDRLDELASAADPWNELVESSPQWLPSSSHAWISSYFEHRLRAKESWVCYLAYDGQELAGVLPIIIAPARFAPFGVQTMRLPDDLHTISVDLVCRPDHEVGVIEALVHRAFEDLPRAPYLAFSRIPERSSVLRWLRMNECNRRHTIEWNGHGAYLSTRDSYDSYRVQLSAKFRKHQGYYSRQISNLPGYSFQTYIGDEAAPHHLDRFMRVEAANWKGQAGTAILASEPLRQFYTTLVRRLHACGWLRWDFIEAEGKSIAAAFSVQLGSRHVVWKPAYDETYERLSPGTVLLNALITSAFEDAQIEEFDLLSDYPYFSKWRVSLRPYYNVRLYRAHPIALLCHYAPTRVKMELRRLPFLNRVLAYLRGRIERVRP